jgi:predicted dehydrogenase
VGGMGSAHATQLFGGEVPGAKLVALCDDNPERLKTCSDRCGKDVQLFSEAGKFFAAGCVDAVIVATPHYDHPPLSIAGFEAGLHVLCEKPAGVYTRHVRELNAAADQHPELIFGLMFNQRTLPVHRKLRELLDGGELGPLKRNNWIITSWYRPQSYYDSGGWRASWAGEGGGVLLNQCPHQLDLWQWFCGMPKRVRAFCSFGKYHDIEVEDDVTAYVEYEDGSTGMFITSTGETPGSNRFEVAGDMGKIVMEDGKLTFWRTRISERQFNREWTKGFGEPEVWKCDIPIAENTEQQHVGVMKQWIKAIQEKDPSQLIADGREGIHELELSNAMLLSAWKNDWVTLPIDENEYYAMLEEKVKTSTYVKDTSKAKVMDTKSSF